MVAGYLERAGFEVDAPADGRAAWTLGRTRRPDLVVLDLMLPGIDGLEVCRRLRASAAICRWSCSPPSATRTTGSLGLELGADDYVTKPFSPRELVLRVQSCCAGPRQPRARSAPRPVRQDGDLRVDAAAPCAAGDVELALTAREFDLLALLMPTRPGVSREELMARSGAGSSATSPPSPSTSAGSREKIEEDPATPAGW